MIYLTGDTHIPYDISKLNSTNLLKAGIDQKTLTRYDYVIILGDFGLFWHDDKEFRFWQKWLEQKPFTVLWVDGNHENHEWISSLPVTEWHDGKVHQTSENIIHLMRGQVFEIDGNTFFTMGGAESYDKAGRTEGVSWWPGEQPSCAEVEEGLRNLERYGNKVDYVLTHDAPFAITSNLFRVTLWQETATQKALHEIWKQLKGFDRWYFGHWHDNRSMSSFTCLYNEIVRLGEYPA